jgi:hypothetical protein
LLRTWSCPTRLRPDGHIEQQAVLARRKQAQLDLGSAQTLHTGGGGASSEPPAEVQQVHLSEVRRLPPSW